MSFQTVCSGCGAISSPSVGICPYCKTLMSSGPKTEASASVDQITRFYNEGNLTQALTVGRDLFRHKPELFEQPAAALIMAKVMIETEAPSSETRAMLVRANVAHPGHPELTEYLEILEARSYLRSGPDAGEVMLVALLRRSPQNVHAHFVLGSHLFWTEKDSGSAIPHLETCVRLRPNFLKAWACLGALYKQLGNEQLSSYAFEKCITMEGNPVMKDFYQKQL